jgi:inhibitor of cysteine peptidase
MGNNMNNSKWFIFSFLATILIITSVPLSIYLTAPNTPKTTDFPESALSKFSSYEELVSFLDTESKGSIYSLDNARVQSFGAEDALVTPTAPEPAPTATEESPQDGGTSDTDFSGTNIQVEGVDEADIVKTDGEYIYIVSGNNLTIVKAYPPEEARVVTKLTFDGGIMGIFINGDKLAVFLNEYILYTFYGGVGMTEPAVAPTPIPEVDTTSVDDNSRVTNGTIENKTEPREPSTEPAVPVLPPPDEPIRIPDEPIVWEPPTTTVKVYDISDKANPVITRDFSIDGNYFNSRMIGDYIYVVSTMYTLYTVTDVALPRIQQDNETQVIEAEDIYYYNFSDTSYSFTTLVALNINNDAQEPTHETIVMGGTSSVYVSTDNIYLTFPDYNWWQEDDTMKTTIQRIQIDEDRMTFAASGEVPGYILNQFSMDEYNGYFRIATTINNFNMRTFAEDQPQSTNNVYVLDMNLNIIGTLENLAPGEQIYSTRFMGNRCYLVTFRNIDPLFVIDLSNPATPTVLGKLKVTGYSGYLHPYDENLLIGIGKETIYDAKEDFAWYQGIKISLFDVSDVSNPVEIAKYEIGDRGTDSPILYDHKSLLFDREKNLLVIPVTVAEINESNYPEGVPDNAYGEYAWQGVYIFNISQEGITLKGQITHIDNFDLNFRYYGYYNYEIERTLYIGNVLYTISHMKVKMNSVDTLTEINTVDIK